MGISYELAEFIANTNYEDIPSYVMETQKKSILDAVGITFGAASLGDGCRQFVELAVENSSEGKGEATVIGFDKKLPAGWAAFANAAMAHSLDFGDTQMDAVVHSNASTFPAALAVAEKLGNVDGKKLLTALVLGSETACRISLGANEDLEKYGFYMPTIYTSFGATAAVCKLLGLTPRQIVDAFSFNLCQTTCSSELMNNSKTVMRSVREAFSARNAVLSGQIAAKGLNGFEEPLEGKLGFYHAYARDNCSLDRVVEGLGKKYYAGTLYFKLWPSCAGTHPAITAVKSLAAEHGIKPEEIERIHVVTSQRNRMLMEPEEIRKAPTTSIIGKFSIPYTASVALIRGDVTLDDFLPEAFKDREVLKLASKFTYEANENWGKAEGMNTDVTIYTGRGNFHYFYTEIGISQKETSFEELELKLQSCARHALTPKTDEELKNLAEIIGNMEKLSSIEEFTSLL
ncbi:MmgE/PrpD family protein [Clostridium sp. MCC353]|uniref:MmgE/PrpD family protein n=1 Tax=Clostridium sp. MCC353 TaxID=2592646 RepID=UPI001C026FF0|nr:MmgE/PrpD family protein [Clostridium sp. MCC353]MBT9775492.1 MmgE/PrpD family protein [Clostridium sp. MCC353]